MAVQFPLFCNSFFRLQEYDGSRRSALNFPTVQLKGAYLQGSFT